MKATENSELSKKLKTITLAKSQDRPKGAFTRAEVVAALKNSSAVASSLLQKLVKEGRLEFAGKMTLPDICGQAHKVPTYRFINKKKKE